MWGNLGTVKYFKQSQEEDDSCYLVMAVSDDGTLQSVFCADR